MGLIKVPVINTAKITSTRLDLRNFTITDTANEYSVTSNSISTPFENTISIHFNDYVSFYAVELSGGLCEFTIDNNRDKVISDSKFYYTGYIDTLTVKLQSGSTLKFDGGKILTPVSGVIGSDLIIDILATKNKLENEVYTIREIDAFFDAIE